MCIGKIDTNNKKVVGSKIKEVITWFEANKAKNADDKANNININKVTVSGRLEKEVDVKAPNI